MNQCYQVTSRVSLIFDINSIKELINHPNQKYMMLYKIEDSNDNDNNEKCKNIIMKKLLVPSLESIINLMQEMDNYLNQNPLHNIGILSLSSMQSSIEKITFISLLYLLHIGKFQESLNLLMEKLTIPSFIRYIYYYHHLLKTTIPISVNRYRLKLIKINTIPFYTNDIREGGCNPYIFIESINNNNNNEIIYNQKVTNPDTIKSYKNNNDDKLINIKFENIFIHLQGDVCISFYNDSLSSSSSSSDSSFMFKVCFHTAFISNDKYLKFERKVIDFVDDDDDLNNFNMMRNHRIYNKDFSIEIFFNKAIDNLSNDRL